MKRAVEITLETDYSLFSDFENSLPLSMLFHTKDSDLIVESINHSVSTFMENHKVDVVLISNNKKRYTLLDKLSKNMNEKERSFINLDVKNDTVRIMEKLVDVWT